ncbi:MAG: hypothetical protein M3P26_16330 [Gemmatimonadota bacterium]|nr:hypothetical protein [Gemmatimonadota bacterium]
MARIRSLKPDFWQDEKMAPLAPIHRLVFLGLISQADDAGRLVDNVRLFDGLLFPQTEESSRESLDILARLKRIVRYSGPSGQRLIQIVRWKDHQKVDNPSVRVFPAPLAELLVAAKDSEFSGESREDIASASRVEVGSGIRDVGDGKLDVPSPPPRQGDAQSPNGSTAQTMVSVVPSEFRPDMASLIALVPNVTAWTAEMRSALEGMHGKPLTFAQLGQAVRDYLASGKAKSSPSLRSFRRYMQGVLEVDGAVPRTNGKPRSMTGTAQTICQDLRQKRNPLFPSSIPSIWRDGLSEDTAETVRPFLSRIFADDPRGEGTLVAQLARALEEAAHV